jgi:hypothetical protein
VASLAEGRLGAPTAYVLPTQRHPDSQEHPLAHLSAVSRALADAEGFDVRAALARDAARFEPSVGPVWGLAPERRPEVLVVARIAETARRPFDRFVAIPRSPWEMPLASDLPPWSSGPIVRQEVVTAYGETVLAGLLGIVVTRFLDCAPQDGDLDPRGHSEWAIVRRHLAPRCEVRSATPELFTWTSAFNSARDLWPGIAGLDQLALLSAAQELEMANHFLEYGLEALAAESDHVAIRMAAGRLLELCDWGLLDLRVTCEPYRMLRELTGAHPDAFGQMLPEEHGLAYIPATEAPTAVPAQRQRGTLLVPLQWIAAALRREIVALVHLVRVASFVRDDSYGKLTGTIWGHVAPTRATCAIPQFATAVARADGLAARFLAEAVAFDTRVYGLQVQRDDYCRAIERQSQRRA